MDHSGEQLTDGDSQGPAHGRAAYDLQVPKTAWSGSFKDGVAEAKFRRFHWRHSYEVQIVAAVLVLAYSSYLLGFFAILKASPSLLPLRLLPLIAAVAWLCGAFYRLAVQSRRYSQAGNAVTGPAQGETLLNQDDGPSASAGRQVRFAEWLIQTNGYQWAVIVITASTAIQVRLHVTHSHAPSLLYVPPPNATACRYPSMSIVQL